MMPWDDEPRPPREERLPFSWLILLVAAAWATVYGAYRILEFLDRFGWAK